MSDTPHDFPERLGRVEGLVQALEELPDTAARETARELVRAFLGLHAAGLRRILELVEAEDCSIDQLADDRLLSGLLLLHGLHPMPAEERVAQALKKRRPRFLMLGGDVELVTVTEEVVRLRLLGDSTAANGLRSEAADAVIEVVPDVATLEFEEVWSQSICGRRSLPVIVGGKS